MKHRFGKTLVLLAAISIVMVGCGTTQSTTKIMWMQHSIDGGTTATYETFNGVERSNFTADEGDVLHLAVDYTIEKGTLGFKLVSPSGEVLWENVYQESGSESFSITAPEKGSYQFQYLGEATGGGFEFVKEISK